jgi:uncharacterized protein
MYTNYPCSLYRNVFLTAGDHHDDYNRRQSNCNQMKVTGKGALDIKPDIVLITFGVTTEGSDPRNTISENSIKLQSVINALKNLGIEDEDLKTEVLSVQPVYDYIDGKQVFRGYRVTNNLRVTVRRLDTAGDVIGAAITSGANVVGNIIFSVDEYEEYYKKALELAVRNAVDKAIMLERTLSISLDQTPVQIIEEKQERYDAVLERSVMQLSEATVPIMGGTIRIRSDVEAVFNYIKF